MSTGLVPVVLGMVTLFTFMDRPLPVTKGQSIASRTIEFSGYTWSVKKGRQPRAGLIANYFLDFEENVWVDEEALGENGYIKSFNERLRDELLSWEFFRPLTEAQMLVEEWRREYNQLRPRSALNYSHVLPRLLFLTLT